MALDLVRWEIPGLNFSPQFHPLPRVRWTLLWPLLPKHIFCQIYIFLKKIPWEREMLCQTDDQIHALEIMSQITSIELGREDCQPEIAPSTFHFQKMAQSDTYGRCTCVEVGVTLNFWGDKIFCFHFYLFVFHFLSCVWHSSAQPFVICVFELVYLNDLHYFLFELVHPNELFCDE